MVHKERLAISLEEKGDLNFRKPELLKSGSNDRCRKSYRRRIRDMGSVCRPRFKSSNEQDGVEDGEFADTLRKAELLDHYNCIWLSSDDASSPTSCSQDDGLFGPLDLKIDAWLISLLSTPSSSRSAELLSTEATFFDGSRVNPIEEASLVLDQREVAEKDVVFQEDLEEEEDEVISWLITSIKNESQDTDEDAESSYGQSSVKDSTELNEFYFLLSKCTLDKRESEFSTPVTKTKSYQLSTSSVYSVTDSSDDRSIFSSSSSSDYSSEVVDMEEIGTDKPLFWPSDWESDWSSDTKSDFFTMSPRKNIRNNSPKTSHHSLNPRVPNGEGKLVFGKRSKSSGNSRLNQTDVVNDARRTRSMPPRLKKPTKTSSKIPPVCQNLELSASSVSTVTYTSNEHSQLSPSSDDASEVVTFDDTIIKTPVFWPTGYPSEWDSDTKWDLFVMSPRKDVHEVGRSPTTSPDAFRLRARHANTNPDKSCSRRLEFSASESTETDEVEASGIEGSTREPVGKHKVVLEDLLLVEKLNVEGVAIEDVLGLKEFDGHEGIESKFNKDGFSLVEI